VLRLQRKVVLVEALVGRRLEVVLTIGTQPIRDGLPQRRDTLVHVVSRLQLTSHSCDIQRRKVQVAQRAILGRETVSQLLPYIHRRKVVVENHRNQVAILSQRSNQSMKNLNSTRTSLN